MKLFIFLFVWIMFFGVAGCPSDNPATMVSKSSFSRIPVTSSQWPSTGDIPSEVIEPAKLILLGTSLLFLAEFVRKRFKK